MKINIIGGSRYGLLRDTEVLTSYLTELGHSVATCNWNDPVPLLPRADLNIFSEAPVPHLFRFAKRQWILPNPEMLLPEWAAHFGEFQYVLCKTRDAYRRMHSAYGEKAVFTNFTCRDMLCTNVVKAPEFLHVAGDSTMKNTEAVFGAWELQPHSLAHPLTVVSKRLGRLEPGGVLTHRYVYVTDHALRNLMNACAFHLCPSQYEGYGHALHEAQSAKAVILTTDAPPMTEFGTPREFLVPVSRVESKNSGELNYVDSCAILQKANLMMQLSDTEIEELGGAARRRFLNDREDFHRRLKELL